MKVQLTNECCIAAERRRKRSGTANQIHSTDEKVEATYIFHRSLEHHWLLIKI